MNSASTTTVDLGRYQRIAFIAGALGIVLLIVGFFVNHDQFFRSYLFAYVFWVGIAVGSLALLMLQHLTGGGWGMVIRRPLEAASRTLPLMLVLVVPIFLGMHALYPWTHAEEAAELAALGKTRYLNTPFFIGRTLFCFAIWLVLAFFLNKWSREQDRTADRGLAKKMRILSGPGMILFVLTVTIVAVDWVMSIDPHWMSTMFGLLFVAAWGVSALAFVIAMMAVLWKYSPLNQIVGQSHFHDLGKLLLALVMLWTYFAFSQYLIIWSGNLPEEITYYLPRTRGAWGVIVLLVVLLHFAFPFLTLLSRSIKRDAGKLVILAALILVMRLVDFFWMVMPNFTGDRVFHQPTDMIWNIAAPIGIGGVWLAFYFWQLGKMSLVALNDPRYETVLQQAHSHSGH